MQALENEGELFLKYEEGNSYQVMGIAITYAIANLAVLGLFFYVTYRMTKKQLSGHCGMSKTLGFCGHCPIIETIPVHCGYLGFKDALIQSKNK